MSVKFKYQAISRDGFKSSGIIEAEREDEVKSIVDSLGLIPLSVSMVAAGGNRLKIMFRKKIDQESLLTFSRKFLSLNRAGIPLIRSLNIIIEDTEDETLTGVLSDIRKSIEGGNNLAESFEKHAGYFPEIFINAIISGEKSGKLDEILDRASEMIGREMKINEQIKTAVRYPSYVLLTISIAFIVVTTIVIPRFAGLYSSYGADLPWATKLLISINRFISAYWYYLLAVSPLLAGSLWRIRLTSWGRSSYDYITLKAPIIGKLMIKSYLARFCYILATFLSSGLPLSQSLIIMRKAIGNYYFSKVIAKMGENLTGGSDLIQPMRDSEFFSPMVVQMAAIGLESGSLESLLLETARHYDFEVERDAKKLTARIEPLLTVLIGAIVLILALAIFVPMWNMIEVFKR